jgi:TonB family protein
VNSIGTSSESAGTESGSTHYVWTFQGAPVRIRIALDAVRRIREYLVAGPGKSEVGGLLLGKPHAGGVVIDDFAPLLREENCGTNFVFSDAQKLDLRNYIEVLNRLGGDLSVVGYFRTDLREGVRLYGEDLTLIEDLFPDRSNAFLVIRPHQNRPPTAGFFFWDDNTIFSSLSFLEFEFDEATLRTQSEARQQAAASKHAAPTKQDTAPVIETVIKAVTPEKAVSLPDPARPRRWLIVGSIAAVMVCVAVAAYTLGVGGILSQRTDNRTIFQPSLGLTASRTGEQINIVWNSQNPLIAEARIAMLTIKDGSVQRDLPLTSEQLKSNRLIYTPQTDTVQIALEAFGRDGKVTRDEVIVLALSNAAAPTPGAIDAQRYRVEVPVTESGLKPQVAESQPVPPKRVREFVPPPDSRAQAPAQPVTAPVESAPALMSRMDMRQDLPIGRQPLASAPAPVPQATPRVAVENSTAPVQAAPQPTPPQTSQPASQPAARPPIPVRQIRPVLPANVKSMLSRRMNVKVRIQVDTTGRVVAAEPLDAEGSLGRFLGSAAAAAARLWMFEPATSGQQKVPAELTLEFAFVPER